MRTAGLVLSILGIPGLLFGFLWIAIYFGSQGTLPIGYLANWNLIIGLIPFLSGLTFGLVGLSLLKSAKRQGNK